jgi:hypothetical protein
VQYPVKNALLLWGRTSPSFLSLWERINPFTLSLGERAKVRVRYLAFA